MVDGPRTGRDGQFYLALDIAAFEDVARFKQRMDGIIREYRSTRLAEAVGRVFLPGEMEDQIERRNRHEGVPLNETTIRNLVEVADRVGADATALR
jgi:LDH2 family malate/lactate/ureidoglycolate dehydrogenase